MRELKILVVEDEGFVREAIIDYLEIKGYENILSASKGEEAIAKIEEEKPDWVLLDIQLADEVDGMVVLERAKEISSNTKVVMMSAYRREHEMKAKKLGAHAFIKKPIGMEQLRDLVKEIQQA